MQRPESNLWELYVTYDEWKEEHDSLHERLLDLCRLMKWNPHNYDQPDWTAHHLEARRLLVPFMHAWRRHLDRERGTIFPIARTLVPGGSMGPIGVLEHDSRIADQYYDAYLRAVEEGASPEESLSHLLQVLMIVHEHFRIEEDTIIPATEQLMREIEYSGS